ncbi:MAG: ISAzo13 family transposase, partial [Planctomycetota bacterium]
MGLLVELLEPETAGSPTGNGQKWCRRSTYWLAQQLARHGVRTCPNSVAKLLRSADYSLRCCRKSISGTNHPDRSRQFQYLQDLRRRFERQDLPIISVDTKNRELVGNFSNKGRTYRQEPYETSAYDFRSDALGVAIPYGVYDTTQNTGTVVVGTTHDTPQFAVDCIETWLISSGFRTYGQFEELLILADAGGSNGASPRLWKYALHECISAAYGISITVCHYPSGASKWNPVEHRLFGPISNNWQGEPLRDYERILGFIGSTKTKTGLQVESFLNRSSYPCGIKVSDNQMEAISLKRAEVLPQWNY